MAQWLRLYSGVVDDPKVQQLSPVLFKCLINLWCIASENDGHIPDTGYLAFKLKLRSDKVKNMLEELKLKGLLDGDVISGFCPHNWEKRQFKSDTSAERTKKWRQQCDVTCDATGPPQVTPPDTDTESETDKALSRFDAGARARAEKNGNGSEARKPQLHIPEKWKPEESGYAKALGLTAIEISFELSRFRLHAKQADRTCADWEAAWQSWCLKALERLGRTPPSADEAAKAGVHVKAGSPQWDAWCKYRGKSMPTDKDGGWWCPSEWPAPSNVASQQ